MELPATEAQPPYAVREVTYTLTEADAIAQQLTLTSRTVLASAALFTILLIGGGVAARGTAPWLGLVVALPVALLWLILPRLTVPTRVRQLAESDPASLSLGEHVLAIGPAGLTWRGAGSEGIARWPYVVRISETREQLHLHTGPSTAFTIPKRAFASRREVEALLADARRWRAAPLEVAIPAPTDRAGFDRFAVELDLRDEDFLALGRFATREALMQRRRWPTALGLALLATATLVANARHGFAPMLAGIVPVLALGALLFAPELWGPWLLRWSLRRLERVYPERFARGAHRLELGAAGVRQSTPLGVFVERWPRIVRVVDDEQHLYLFNGPTTAFILPKRAFANTPAGAELLQAARTWQESAPRLPPRPPRPLQRPKAPRDPFAPPDEPR